MVVLAIAVCSRGGIPIFSRQTSLMLSKSRVESLLSEFPQLIKSGQQHTYVENDFVRFIYHPIESYYLTIITNKLSNILQDLETMQLLAKVLSERCDGPIDEHSLRDAIFDVLVAFDEIVNLGYRESVNISSVKTILAMESHEEMVQEIIARNKMQEAREAAKLKIKQIELQKKEAARRSGSGSFGQYPSTASESSFQARSVPVETIPISQPTVSRLGKGMKLGRRADLSNDKL